MRRLWYLMWKELLELRQDPRLFGVIFIAPIVQLTFLGYAATTDVQERADRRRRSGPHAAEPRADHAVRCLAVLHGRRQPQHRCRARPLVRRKSRVDGPGDSRRLSRARRQRPSGDRAGHCRRHRLELDERRDGLCGEPGERLQRGACARAADRRRARTCRRGPSTRGFASGSTRSSKAATS